MSDGRTGKRFPLELPTTIRTSESDKKKHSGVTSNVSAAGVYIVADAPMAIGSIIEFELTLPKAATGTKKEVRLQCKGRVMRAEEAAAVGSEAAKTGVACVIDQYKFVRG